MSLDRLFAPRSIAVYGASASDPSKLGNALLANAASGSGEVIAVHPSATGIDGIEAVGRLDRAVDLALVSVPAHRAEAAVADAATAGVGCAVVLSSGFAEAGPEGRKSQDRLAALARRQGMRLVGPNCMGVVSHLGGGRWLNGSYFWAVPERPGGLSFISQSGAFGAMFFAYLRETGLGLSRFLSVGNSVDVSVTDTLEWLGKDDLTTAIGMFVEGIDDGRRFVDVARRVTARKPVVMLKAGKMAAGARAALSHTGSMAGSHQALQAGLRRAKVTEAVDADALFDRLDIISAGAGLRAVRSIGVVTISGGPGVLAADAAERLGLRLPHLLDGSVKALAPLVPAVCIPGEPDRSDAPVLARPYGPRHRGRVPGPEHRGGGRYQLRARRARLRCGGGSGRSFHGQADHRFRARCSPCRSRTGLCGGAALPDTRASRGCSRRRGKPVRLLTEWESKDLLGAGLPRPHEVLACSSREAEVFARSVGGALVAKACGVAHKTDRGLVRRGWTLGASVRCGRSWQRPETGPYWSPSRSKLT